MSFSNFLLSIAPALVLSASGASAGAAPVAGVSAKAGGVDAASYKIYSQTSAHPYRRPG
jgi:hypothetical protein